MTALLTLLLAAAPASAALTITASVNKTALSLDDQLVLSVAISAEAASLPEPELPSLPRFNVHSAGRSQSMTFINGRMSNAAEYTYVLVPRMVGNAVIPPITVHAAGQAAQTDPISVTVTRPNEPPPAAAPAAPGAPPQAAAAAPGGQGGPAARRMTAPVFVTAETDKKDVWVNEQVVYTVRFHYAIPLLGNAEWSPPDSTGFLSEDLPPSPAQTAAVNGRSYNVSEVKIALFPLTPGSKTVGAGTIRCQVQKGVDVDPFASDFFRNFFSAGLTMAEPVSLQTKPLSVSVKPLPEAGKPAGFSGAVGRFRVKAEADKTSVKAGDAINLTVTVEGNGNLKAIGDLPLPEMPEFRVYDTVSSLNQSKDGSGVRGSKVFKTVVVPKVSGTLRIPPVVFQYFDPATGRYASAQTAPIEVDAAPGEAAQAPVGFNAAAAPAPAAITPLSEDIRHVSSKAGSDAAAAVAASVAGAGLAHAFPAALLGLSALGAWWKDRQEQDPAGNRARRAARTAQDRLSRSRSTATLPEASGLVGDALVGFVADKLGVPAAGLTSKQAADALRRRWPRMPAGHLEQLKRLWGEMERLRYAPTTVRDTDVDQLREAVAEFVDALDEAAR